MTQTVQTKQIECELGRVTIATEPRPGRERNEDLVEVAGSAGWVLDGASVWPQSAACEHDAYWYVNQLSTGLDAEFQLSMNRPLQEVLGRAIERVASQHTEACTHTELGNFPSASVGIIRRQARQLDYLILGDVYLLLERENKVEVHTDKRLSQVLPDLRQRILELLASGESYENPEYRELVNTLRKSERAKRNTADGYWIASDDPAAAQHAICGSCSLDDIHRLALMTDGLSRSVTTLNIYPTWEELLQNLFDHGPSKTISTIRETEIDDPDGKRYPRTNQSDDATAMICEL